MKLKRKLLRALTAGLVGLLICTVTLELLLRIIDPWQLVQGMAENRVFWSHVDPDDRRGYSLRPGRYDLGRWTLTVNADRTRFEPADHAGAACQIVILGDSVSMGAGVNDADTFPNVLAGWFPSVHIINPSVSGYNVANMLRLKSLFPADGYFYLLIDNDADPDYDYKNSVPDVSVTSLYWWFSRDSAVVNATAPRVLPVAFRHALESVLADDRVTVAAFRSSGGLGSMAAAAYPSVHLIPPYLHRLSYADPHPDRAGHLEIANSIKPLFESLVSRVCFPVF